MKCVPRFAPFAWLFLVVAMVSAFAQVGRPVPSARRSGGGGRAATDQAKTDVPLATFTGAVRVIDTKTLTIDVAEGNTLEFICTRKTGYYDGSKKIKVSAINLGDTVTVEARPDLLLKPEAVIVHLEHPKPAEPEKPAN